MTKLALMIFIFVSLTVHVDFAQAGGGTTDTRALPDALSCSGRAPNLSNPTGGVLSLWLMSTSVVHAANRLTAKTPALPDSMKNCRLVGKRGIASLYGTGDGFAGSRTASGQKLNPNAMTVAHRTLPFGTEVTIRDPSTGKTVKAIVNDRGPFTRGRIIDLTAAVFKKFGSISEGILKNIEVYTCS